MNNAANADSIRATSGNGLVSSVPAKIVTLGLRVVGADAVIARLEGMGIVKLNGVSVRSYVSTVSYYATETVGASVCSDVENGFEVVA